MNHDTHPPALSRSRNIKWRTRLGSVMTSQPIVSGGLVWIGTNNEPPRDSTRPFPGGVLACFRERDGAFLYQKVFNTTYRLNRRAEFGLTGSLRPT